MIRQTITCDICGTEKKQTNHWFVTYIQGGELRIRDLSSGKGLRGRPGSRHLCGQTCLTKLVDEFVAGVLANRPQAPTPAAPEVQLPAITSDISLTSNAAYARSSFTPKAVPSALPQARPLVPAAVVAISAATAAVPSPTLIEELPNYASRHWRTEAWERERERERRSNLATRRKNF